MGGDHAHDVNHEVAFGHREVALGGLDPQRRAAEARVEGRLAAQLDRRRSFAGVDRQHAIGTDLRRAERRAAEQHAVAVGREIEGIADAEARDHETERMAQLAAQPGEAGHQRGRPCARRRGAPARSRARGRDERLLGNIGDRDARRVQLRFRLDEDRVSGTTPGGGAFVQTDARRRAAGRCSAASPGSGPSPAEDAGNRNPDGRVGQLAADLAGEVAVVGRRG